MKSPLWIALWAVTLVGAWYVGSEHLLGVGASGSASGGVTSSDRLIELEEQVDSLKQELASRGPRLTARGGADGAGSTDGSAGDGRPDGAVDAKAFEPVYEFSWDGIKTPEQAVDRFLAYARTMLGMGREGHLKLFEQICTWGEDREFQKRVEMLFGRGERAARHLVPLIQAALDHREALADMNETLLVQMVEKPEYFADKDDDPLEIFTEGLGMVLPAVVSEERLATWTSYVKAILAQDEATQPKAIQKSRRDLERLIRAWMPDMDPDEIFKMLDGGVSPDEALALIEQLPPDALERVDIGQYLGPKVAAGDWRAMRLLRRFQLSDNARARLDVNVQAGVANGNLHGWHIADYLRSTGRHTWDAARGFIEQGLRDTNPAVRDKFAQAALNVRPRPSADWAREAMQTFELSDNMRSQFKRIWNLD